MIVVSYGFVYIWFDRKRCMFYIGSHQGLEDDGYIASSVRVCRAYLKRPQDFRRRILQRVVGDRKAIRQAETKWLLLINPNDLGRRYYNLKRAGEGGNTFEGMSKKKLERIKRSISIALTGTKATEQRKRLISAALINKPKSMAARKAMSLAKAGRLAGPPSDEHRLAISRAHKGKPKQYRTKSGNVGKYGITNGKDNTFILPTSPIPDGWEYGMTKQTFRNPRWITNGISNLFVSKDMKLPDGWYFGRILQKPIAFTAKNNRWITNGRVSRYISIASTPSEGWWFGRTLSKRNCI